MLHVFPVAALQALELEADPDSKEGPDGKNVVGSGWSAQFAKGTHFAVRLLAQRLRSLALQGAWLSEQVPPLLQELPKGVPPLLTQSN